MAKETMGKTFFVAFALCVVCSVLVSGAAVVLKPTQVANKLEDKKKNILRRKSSTLNLYSSTLSARTHQKPTFS